MLGARVRAVMDPWSGTGRAWRISQNMFPTQTAQNRADLLRRDPKGGCNLLLARATLGERGDDLSHYILIKLLVHSFFLISSCFQGKLAKRCHRRRLISASSARSLNAWARSPRARSERTRSR